MRHCLGVRAAPSSAPAAVNRSAASASPAAASRPDSGSGPVEHEQLTAQPFDPVPSLRTGVVELAATVRASRERDGGDDNNEHHRDQHHRGHQHCGHVLDGTRGTAVAVGFAVPRSPPGTFGGNSRGSGPADQSNEGYEVTIGKVVVGDLTGDSSPEAVVPVICAPRAASPNFFTVEMQIYAAGPATTGPRLLATLRPPPGTVASDFRLEPRFNLAPRQDRRQGSPDGGRALGRTGPARIAIGARSRPLALERPATALRPSRHRAAGITRRRHSSGQRIGQRRRPAIRIRRALVGLG